MSGFNSFNKEELRKIAHLSALKIDDQESDLFVEQIKTILAYVDQLQEIHITTQAQNVRNINVLREDEAFQNDSSEIMAQAPERNENYFVVPTILEEK